MQNTVYIYLSSVSVSWYSKRYSVGHDHRPVWLVKAATFFSFMVCMHRIVDGLNKGLCELYHQH